MHPVEVFELVLMLLAAVVALHWAAERLGLPPSAALLVGGGALAFLPVSYGCSGVTGCWRFCAAWGSAGRVR